MKRVRSLLRDRRGASAVEFALVVPLLLLLIFGVIDAGRFMWEYNEAEKATQMGVRYAVATDLIPGQDFANYSFAVSGGITQGDPVPASAFEKVICTQGGCICTPNGGICSTVAINSTAFNNLVARMQAMYGPISANKVQIEYRNVGLGYAGDPNGPDVAPLVTVSLINMNFRPLTCMYFLCDVGMSGLAAALTLEDGAGSAAN